MNTTYFLLFIMFSAFAQNSPRIQVLPNPESLEDFTHEFKGCPENSDCDQVMGHMFTKWRDLVQKYKNSSDTNKAASELEAFRRQYGIPVEFYTFEKAKKAFMPATHTSECKEHNPKQGEKIIRGTSFIRSIDAQKAQIWRDQSLIELPLKDNLVPQSITVFYESGPQTYNIPLNDQPLFIKNKELFILKEDDGLYFMLRISPQGDWKIIEFDMTNLGQFEDKKENVACPVSKHKAHVAFTNIFCKKIYDMDSKKLVITQMAQGCSI
jgi:hypothetical protein